ncbi:hypothetical protein [Prescottella subtropica]|uniref:hypothetical protein n=1 Tax=Prescottella subtropica TaxID=2545757 RepID=UPI0010F863EA|nr:hypothetical protein [Prescottella subtropica]
MVTTPADAILAGPRGRRLCLELATSFPVSDLKHLAAAIDALDLTRLTPARIQAALGRAVDSAMYWQEPDGTDVLAAEPLLRTALRGVAEHVTASPSTDWFTESRRPEQWAIAWHADRTWPPLPTNPQHTLQQWARDTRVEEEHAAHNPHAFDTGHWWSMPLGLVTTVGHLPETLNLVEDGFGWEGATTIPVRGSGRTFEVRSPDDWIVLCRTYPLEVTASRGPDWFRATGRSGRWVIPDWERVATEWDAVHLTPLAYLSGATRALPVDADTATVIAGWDPGRTIWLTDVVTETDSPRREWRLDHGPDGEAWVPAR